MERRTDQRVLNSIGKAIAVQQISLLLGGWHPAFPARGPKSGLDELRSQITNDLPLRDEQYSAQLRRLLLRIEAKFYVYSLAPQ